MKRKCCVKCKFCSDSLSLDGLDYRKCSVKNTMVLPEEEACADFRLREAYKFHVIMIWNYSLFWAKNILMMIYLGCKLIVLYLLLNCVKGGKMGKKSLKLIGQQNRKLRTVCHYETTLKKARQIGIKLIKFLEENPGLGLSANQVGIMERICVADLYRLNTPGFVIMINPRVIHESKKMQLSRDEGCMSIPGKRFDIKRAQEIEINWLNENGQERQTVFSGLNAIVVKHEIDHLNGILLSDYKKNGKLKEEGEKSYGL